MKILVACEFSGVVRRAFREKGHDAWSCDLIESEDNSEYHIQRDVQTCLTDYWDMMIAFPPCTYLTTTANRVYLMNPRRWEQRLDAMKFVYNLWTAPIHRIAIENPKGAISTHIGKPDQIIQPYYFGHADSKMTCLWLKNLPKLKYTKIVQPEWVYPKSGSGKRMSKTHANNPSTNNPENAKLRSITYQGVADAMAEQWSEPAGMAGVGKQLKCKLED